MDGLIVGLLTAAVLILTIIVATFLIMVIMLVAKLKQISDNMSAITGSIADITSALTPASIIKSVFSLLNRK